jgi:hypothetical protein
VGGIGLGSCPVADFGISSTEALGSATREVVTIRTSLRCHISLFLCMCYILSSFLKIVFAGCCLIKLTASEAFRVCLCDI